MKMRNVVKTDTDCFWTRHQVWHNTLNWCGRRLTFQGMLCDA